MEPYVQHNEHEKGKKVLKCKGRPGYPGPDWFKFIYGQEQYIPKRGCKA